MSILKRWKGVFDSASLTGTFQDLGAVVDFPVLKISIVNSSDVACLITDGSSEDDIEVPSSSTLNVGEGIVNPQGSSLKYIFSANTQLQIKQKTAAGTGNITVMIFG
jgi:hypothetical protein